MILYYTVNFVKEQGEVIGIFCKKELYFYPKESKIYNIKRNRYTTAQNGGNKMDREMKDLIKILAILLALAGTVVAGVLLVVKYKEEICDFFAELKMKCPCAHREEDDYADEELNSICDLEGMAE